MLDLSRTSSDYLTRHKASEALHRDDARERGVPCPCRAGEPDLSRIRCVRCGDPGPGAGLALVSLVRAAAPDRVGRPGLIGRSRDSRRHRTAAFQELRRLVLEAAGWRCAIRGPRCAARGDDRGPCSRASSTADPTSRETCARRAGRANSALGAELGERSPAAAVRGVSAMVTSTRPSPGSTSGRAAGAEPVARRRPGDARRPDRDRAGRRRPAGT